MAAAFRLMTANLLVDRCDLNDLTRVLGEVVPDVVVTQELGPNSAEVIQGALPNHRLRPSLDFTGRGIATRFDASFGEIGMPGRPGTSAILDIEGSRVSLAGMHLLNPIIFPWWVTASARGRQLDGLFAWLDQVKGPVVVAGDFNASPRWPAYKRSAERLTDLVTEHAGSNGASPERTWSWRPGWPRMLRIDHVFGDGVVAREVGVVRISGTDHHAVIVDIDVLDPESVAEDPDG